MAFVIAFCLMTLVSQQPDAASVTLVEIDDTITEHYYDIGPETPTAFFRLRVHSSVTTE